MKLRIYRVEGDSMSPSFLHNDYVLTFKWSFTRWRLGDVIVLKHDTLGILIKRISQIQDNEVLLAGDNPASTPSEAMGWQRIETIHGKVLCKLSPTKKRDA